MFSEGIPGTSRRNMATAANPDSAWPFPGGMPGRHIDAARIANKLRAAGVPVPAARMGTWRQLVREAPPSILAAALGIAPVTAMKHAERAGVTGFGVPRCAGHRTPWFGTGVTKNCHSDELG